MSDIYLSVIIPVYNAANTIQDCVESVVSEAVANSISYEIILINDGSTDNSLEMCEKLSDGNSNIKVVSQNNSGPSAARNNGLRIARGDFIAFNDADDKWLSGKLKEQLEEFNSNPDIDLLCAKYGECRRAEIKQKLTFKKEAFHNYFSPQTSIFRKKILVCGKIKFPEKQKYSEDMRFIIEVMQHCKCMYVPFLSTTPIVSKCVFGDSGLSSHLWKMEKGELSNILYIFRIKQISFLCMIMAVIWSLVKFCRRAVISCFLKIKRTFRKNNNRQGGL